LKDLNKIFDDKDKEILENTGIDIKRETRAGTFIQSDHSVVACDVRQDGIEILPINDAYKKYPWLNEYKFKSFGSNIDDFLKDSENKVSNGYFIYAKKGAKTKFPVQSCLYISSDNVEQFVHNIIIADEGADLQIISGCSTSHRVNSALHVGISEFFVKKNAKLSFTMIHKWGENVTVTPRSSAVVEDNGVFISNYISFDQVKFLKMYPAVYLNGENSVGRFSSIVFAPEKSYIDLGSKCVLNGKSSKAEIVSRTVSAGGTIIARGHLVGNAKDIKAHLECNGLLLKNKGIIHAIPELEAHLNDVDMSHEAAVGKIAEEEIEYLMARGLTEEEATSAIVRGFLNIKIEGLPDRLEKQIETSLNELSDKFF